MFLAVQVNDTHKCLFLTTPKQLVYRILIQSHCWSENCNLALGCRNNQKNYLSLSFIPSKFIPMAPVLILQQRFDPKGIVRPILIDQTRSSRLHVKIETNF